jgi:AraC-like DNA-binding protein
MDLKARNRFQKVISRPRWEGVIFMGIDLGDPRISVSAAEPVGVLKDYIEYIWYMKWHLNEDEGLQGIVAPNPCAKLVALQQNEKTFPPIIVGAKNQAELFELHGAGATVGFDFKPGGLYAVFEKSMSNWPESGIKAEELLKNLPLISKEIWTESSLSRWLNEAEGFLVELLNTSHKNNCKQISLLVDGVFKGLFENPEDMALKSGMSLRSLQRIFQDEVGISPRDLLRINRFNETIRKVSQDDFKAFADIALESGFFDQPHMTNEFQKLIATPPSKFRRYL